MTTLRIAYGGHSMMGVKDRNEDAFAAILPTGATRLGKGAVASIADGVSCSDNARIASQTAVGTFIQDYLSTPETWDVKTSASRVLSSLNSWLYYQGQTALTRHNGFVTTFSTVIVKSTTAHLLHCGDSRIYRWRDGQLLQLTADHTLVQNGGVVTLTRALGMDTELKVDYQQRSVRVGDLLLLTTDGVHEKLRLPQLAQALQQLSFEAARQAGEGRNGVLEKLAQTIAQQALDAHSTDNLTCLLLLVLEVPLEDLDETHRKLTELAIPPVLQPGNKIDGYNIQRVLHNGARSHVYLATHPRFRQKFVLKAPSSRFSEDPHYLEGFIREQWVGRRVDNPALMKIYEPVPDSRFLYHICEYIEGSTLRQWIYDHPQPALTEVRTLARQIANSLRVLQRQGMLHRDLKPDNIMVTPNGEAKLIDFGTVRVSGLKDVASPVQENVPVGTADYLAPECYFGDDVAARSDIFSFGVIVYEMLTGSLPFKPPPTDTSRVRDYDYWKYQSACDKRKDLPRWMDMALRKACAPRPAERYTALSEFMHDLEVPNVALMAGFQHRPLIEKNPVRFWQGVSLLLVLLLIVQALLH
ncbi:MAG TPA: bifunctional protein-serine/threonine kinase/phosphatase [Candidatus Acidoferrum sp.]|nr:bifunctional protein-serine/threonine kinase/phosphatase [Candidatus Acidoferrum sp.]